MQLGCQSPLPHCFSAATAKLRQGANQPGFVLNEKCSHYDAPFHFSRESCSYQLLGKLELSVGRREPYLLHAADCNDMNRESLRKNTVII